jgi:MoaA/NifB/PqqE/SkfB family radical SAM enzyme
LLTDEEKLRIIEIDKKMNRRWGYPKVTSSLRAESAEMFGCGAGIQHSYIDAIGNVYPCDFVPLSFGNINNRSFREIWSDVARAMGKPRVRCFMNQNVQLVQKLSNGDLPLLPQQSQSVCQCSIQDDTMPFYETWGGLFQ